MIKKIKDYYEPIQAYHYWQENILTQKEELQDTILLEKTQINDLIRQQNAHHESFKMSRRRYEQNDDSFTHELASLENKLGVIAEITDKINLKLSLAYGENIAENFANPPHPMPFEVLIKSANDKLASLNQGIERSIKIAKNSHNALTGKLYETWEMRMQKYHHDDKFSTPYYLGSLREMVDMMVDEIPTQRQATLQAFRTLSHGMTEYYEQLHAFHKRVTAKSNEISKEINHNHGFTALDDITISLTSVLFNKGQDELRKFVEAYHDEIGSGNLTVLPSLALRQSFKQAIIWLEGNKFDTENTASLIELNIRYKENNREVVVRHDEDLTKGSSTGLSILLITVIFASLTRYLCPDDNTIIHWSIDEIGKLDDGNIKKLFTFMDKQKVQLFCAQPNPNPVLNKLFVHKNDINRDIGVRHYINHTKPLNPQLAQTLLKVN